MFHLGFSNQKSFTFQNFDEFVVRILDEETGNVGGFLRHRAVLGDKLHVRQILSTPDSRVVLTEGRREMHDPRPVRQRDVRIGDDEKRTLAGLFHCFYSVRVKRHI